MLPSSHQTKRASNVLENWEATLDSLVLWGILRRELIIAPHFQGLTEQSIVIPINANIPELCVLDVVSPLLSRGVDFYV